MASRRRTIAVDVKSLRSGNGPNKINKNATAKKPIQPASESNGIVQSRCTQAAEKTSTSKSNPVNVECVSSPQRHVLTKPSTSKVKMGTSPRCSMGPSSSGTSKIVPSRYMQAVERSSLSKSNSHNNDSGSLQPKFSQPKPSRAKSTPPQCSMGPLASGTSKASHQDESLLLRKTVLQSTFSDGQVLPPDFDFSVIGDKTVPQSANETVRNHEDDKNCIEMQAWSLAFITAKMAHNMAKLKPEAEARLLHMMEEEEELHSKVIAKKRQYHLLEKQRQANELLDLQISALTPALETVQPFTESYKTLASAVDTTRHVLPVKNFHIAGDSREFLDKAEACLRESEVLLRECTDGNHEENRVILECLKAIKRDCKEMRQHLPGLLSELSELSSLQSRHSVLVQQAEEEEKLGPEKLMELCCPKQ
ncbi:HAUS augmin-like complex subunit 8 [Syngnathus scovelli]|uniref:HAUS augmin-like complex subunit 8 n=1 Tax=Syngnathus scovelli TaxID=161590 RepID=UPI002110E585|nr:HAUS augmin-like complex subunit 8 [Syngnathus scovelli]